jgi:acetyl-CoA carboxylase biotin carboxyl carrier protein
VAKDEKSGDKPSNPDLQQLQELYELMREKGLDTLELKDEDLRIRLSRAHPGFAAPGVPHAPRAKTANPSAPADAEASAAQAPARAIASPLAGVFYRASSPTSPPFVKEGDIAEAGQTLCIVEAMKVMNEIKAESRSRILKILAENARPVSAGQALFQVESA